MWPPAPGERISKYRLERLLGAGGMGAVYLARDLDLDRDVAIKFIAEDKAADPDGRRRLIREARAAAGLDHPNICAVYDVATDPDGRAYIVMQYVEGDTLADRMRRGLLDTREALLVATDVASALAAAHRRGIVHRDVKPQNIIITPSGRAKLLDFGIARLDDLGTSSGTTETRLTGPGRLPGTPAYMSPEQVLQKPLDGRSDLFSLGAVLYECLTGRLPFDAKTAPELYGQILHVHPPPVSSLREGLSEREDELCRRLLAKHADDRFASADELLGALRVLLPDTARPSGTAAPAPVVARHRAAFVRRNRLAIAFAVVALAAAAAVWLGLRPRPLPAPPPEAARWYARGTEALRDGAYHSARLALEEAIKIFPDYALAHARIAEAHGELDESDHAQTALLKADRLVDDRSRLAVEDRLRLDGVRALTLRDFPAAVRAYTELAGQRAADAGVWLDLGRAQEAASQSTAARASYERAIAIDKGYAAAHLRRAIVLGQQGQRDESLREYAEAERLYRAASNLEGETEALLRRGISLNAAGRIADARATLERAAALAGGSRSRSQEIRARLRLGSLTAAQGRFADAEKMVTDALAVATEHGLETFVAAGLIDLSVVLQRMGRRTEAEAHLSKAMQLADKRGAHRTHARAALQRASVLLELDRAAEALALSRATVETVRARQHRDYELMGLAITARAHEALEHYGDARRISEDLLRAATEAGDERQRGQALENLAGASTAAGDLPGALDYRQRLEELHRRQQDVASLPYDLTNRAELLIRLGRHDEAAQLLDEVEKGATAGNDAYKRRMRRVTVLRALGAAVSERFDAAAAAAAAAIDASGDTADSTRDLAASLLRHAEARLQRRASRASGTAASGTTSPAVERELRYWDNAARLARGDAAGVLRAVAREFEAPPVSPEFEWRLAALGSAAAVRANDAAKAKEFSARADAALQRVRAAWAAHAVRYEARPDLVELRRHAGLNPRS